MDPITKTRRGRRRGFGVISYPETIFKSRINDKCKSIMKLGITGMSFIEVLLENFPTKYSPVKKNDLMRKYVENVE